MKLRYCKRCKKYTFKEVCTFCEDKTFDAHYKFIKIKDAPPSDINIVQNR